MITVFIVDDHSVVVEGIYSILKNERNISLAGHAYDADGCLQYFKKHTADVVLMDISMPGMDGIALCRIMKRNYPATMIIALTTFNQASYITKMINEGASGYLLKNSDKIEIINAIETVYSGKTWIGFEISRILVESKEEAMGPPYITKREKEVLACIATGLTNMEIAEKLFISFDTVASHRKNLYSKLQVKNTAQLLRIADEYKLI